MDEPNPQTLVDAINVLKGSDAFLLITVNSAPVPKPEARFLFQSSTFDDFAELFITLQRAMEEHPKIASAIQATVDLHKDGKPKKNES